MTHKSLRWFLIMTDAKIVLNWMKLCMRIQRLPNSAPVIVNLIWTRLCMKIFQHECPLDREKTNLSSFPHGQGSSQDGLHSRALCQDGRQTRAQWGLHLPSSIQRGLQPLT